jgi:hypothetical protein
MTNQITHKPAFNDQIEWAVCLIEENRNSRHQIHQFSKSINSLSHTVWLIALDFAQPNLREI